MNGGGYEGTADTHSTSSSLIAAAQAHEPQAWDRLAELYGPVVYQWSRGAGLQPPDAADVAQEVFQKLQRALDGFEHRKPKERFRAWLWTITRNEVRQHFRRAGRQPQAPGGTAAQQAFQQLADLDDCHSEPISEKTIHQLVHRALRLIRDEFTPSTWAAFWRTTVDEVAAADVADELGISAAAVRQAKYRVLGRLRQMLAEE